MEPKTKHFLALDGLRGLVAVFVMMHHYFLFHGMENILPRGYLGVDFFFVLSGFVVAHAYEHKLMTLKFTSAFIIQRIVRLFPMIIFSVSISYMLTFDKSYLYAFILNLLMVPNFFDSNGALFPINSPTWSLFYEIFINIFYALFIDYLVKSRLFALLIFSGIALCIFSIRLRSVASGTLQDTFIAGFFRVSFSYYAGVIICRYNAKKNIKKDINLFYSIVILITMMAVPKFSELNTPYDLLFVIMMCPIIVFIGANSRVSGKKLYSLCKSGGEISYPLYLIHMPVQILAGPFIMRMTMLGKILFCIPLSCITIVLSLLILRFYDAPVRYYLGMYVRKAMSLAVKPI